MFQSIVGKTPNALGKQLLTKIGRGIIGLTRRASRGLGRSKFFKKATWAKLYNSIKGFNKKNKPEASNDPGLSNRGVKAPAEERMQTKGERKEQRRNREKEEEIKEKKRKEAEAKKPKPSSGPLKNRSGDPEDAAKLARSESSRASTAGKSKTSTPRKVGNLEGGPLEKATQVSGNFSLENGPKNGTLYRADNQGNITSYATYDGNGMIIKRVDVTGAPHRGGDTPHVIEYGRNSYVDKTGKTIMRVQSPDTKLPPRSATGAEIP